MNQVIITFISAGPTRSGDKVQARFRIVERKPGSVSKSYVRSWTMLPEHLAIWMKAPKKAAAAMVSWLLRKQYGVSTNPRDCVTECSRALAALHEAATGRAAQAKERHQLAQAEQAVRVRIARALALGVTEARIHEIAKECVVRNVMEV
jgi:hypothetical protein